MQYPREKTPVCRVIIDFGGEHREYVRPLIAIDPATIAVHIWAENTSVRPTVTVPLSNTMIEWHASAPEPAPDTAVPVT
jgi:hypothetical protein